MNPIKTHLLNRLRPQVQPMTTLTDEEAFAFGVRAVEAGMHHAIGMSVLTRDGRFGLIVGLGHEGVRVLSQGSASTRARTDVVPDLRDPGTKGHAVAQLRQRTEDPGLTINSRHRTHMLGLAPTALQWWADGSTAYCDTEEEAIVAAFEATKETP